MGDFNHPDICCIKKKSRHARSRRFLQYIKDNFLTQLVKKPMKRGVLLDLVQTNKGGLIEGVKAGGSSGCSNHEMMEFGILC